MAIEILAGLTLNDDGVLCNKNRDPVHLRQGDLDGACGPYCVIMALLLLNILDSDELPSIQGLDYRTRIGKLFREIKRLQDPMLIQGTSISELKSMLSVYPNVLTNTFIGSPAEVLSNLGQAISAQHPVIVDVVSRKTDGLRHWTLAIGQCDEFIYLLDPGYELPVASCWNAVLSKKPQSNRYGYRYINPWVNHDVETNVMLEVILS